jgi:2-hydroxychromene-2-carboxylate isomerase
MNDEVAPVRWYFDAVSPFAWLQWPKVQALAVTRAVTPVPVLLAAILSVRGQKGPAEIPGKREFTYRHVLWQARRDGVPLRFPPAHPFNPLAALRTCIAAGNTPEAIDAVLGWIWRDGHAGDSVEALEPLLAQLGLAAADLATAPVKQALRTNTEAALAAGVYGVPTLQVGEALFWGNDATDFALAALEDPALLQDPEMERLAGLPVGAERR